MVFLDYVCLNKHSIITVIVIMIVLIIRKFKDVVFEDVVFDTNSCVTLLSIVCIVTSMPNVL